MLIMLNEYARQVLMSEKWFTSSEAAVRLNCSVMTIHRWMDDGYFPNARRKSPTPRSPREIPESDIIEFERQREEVAHDNK
jgi:predicted site-specific integrase-resolvase